MSQQSPPGPFRPAFSLDSDCMRNCSPHSPNSPPPPPFELLNKPPTSSSSSLLQKDPALSKAQSRLNAEEEKQQRRAEREQRKREKEEQKEAARKQRIRSALTSHQSTSLGRQSSVTILVSSSMYNDRSKNDILKQLRILYPQQIEPDPTRRMASLITWRRLNVKESMNPKEEDVPMCIIYFSADDYLNHMANDSLDLCANRIKEGCLQLHRIVFVVSGMNRELTLRMRRFTRNGTNGGIISKDVVQDSYVYLYMTHGIRTHETANLDEFAHYLCDVTDAIAAAPYRQKKDFLSASLLHKVTRAKASNRTVVVSSQPAEESADDKMADEDIDPFGYDPSKKTSQIRVEGTKDLGNMYLSMLCLIPGVTITKARAIRQRYPTLRLLLDAYDDCRTEGERGLMLAELRSGEAQRRFGPVLSKGIAAVLNSMDPDLSV